jgi:UDP-glucose 4-epimerase
MNILITGSSGFIGRNFIKLSSGLNIREVDLLTTSPEEVDFSGIDSVLHLAAIVHHKDAVPVDQYFKINRDLAYEMALKSKEHSVNQFVLISTSKVYGDSSPLQDAWNEKSVCNPIDPYSQSKYEAEKLVGSLADDKFKVAIIRPPLVYGPRVKANMLNLIKMVDICPILPFKGINNRRSMVYVGNLVALLQHVIEKQASGVFLTGDLNPISTSKLVEIIAHCLNKRRIMIKTPKLILRIAGMVKPEILERLYGSFVLDNSITNSSLQFIPPYSCQEGIAEMVKWYKALEN